MAKFLQIGDVFAIKPGHNIQVNIPERYVYSNTPRSNKITTTTIEVGTAQYRHGAPNEAFDTSIFIGQYVVIGGSSTGGGTGHGPSDFYPDGWEVRAKKLDPAGLWDENGIEVMFYQSGSFTCKINEELPVIKKMKMMFV